LAVLVFAIAMAALYRTTTSKVALDGELPPDNHFELDSVKGVFCETKNVRSARPQYFDVVDIGLSNCSGTSQSGSRSYRIVWPPQGPRSVVFESRRNFRQCDQSDFAERAPPFVTRLEQAFRRTRESVPCDVRVSVDRIIHLTYVDLRDESHEVAFLQSYNRDGKSREFGIEQASTKGLLQSDQMETFDAGLAGDVLDTILIQVAGQFGIPDVPVVFRSAAP
jgi:hypothetical protein